MNYYETSLAAYRKNHGVYTTASKMPLETKDDLSVAYTPGIAEPCRQIAKDPSLAWELTMKGNSVVVVSDGSAILGLGNIGPLAGLPVMEGKSVLYKKYANVDAIPIVLASQNVDEIVEAIRMIAPTFGGIHLEDIAAPACFEVERRLSAMLDIPVMHDDQHATAIITLAGLWNALKVVEKKIEEVKIVVNGAGAAGLAITKLLLAAGAKHMVVLDSKGIIAVGREGMNSDKDEFAAIINPTNVTGTLVEAMKDSDVFIGVSKPGLVTAEMVRTMKPRAIIFALANPEPEITPEEAKKGGAEVIATGRSDFPNQINNVLVFPGLFRGLLDSRVKTLTDAMRIAASKAIADLVEVPTAEKIVPAITEINPAPFVAAAITKL
ncbi:TPA: NAD-dependent malic enzyme [Candidatus Uhrbacteria bacterium]|nr:NAD-dependent malic enzyme [Candidatus Uhrbacteria bacterium]